GPGRCAGAGSRGGVARRSRSLRPSPPSRAHARSPRFARARSQGGNGRSPPYAPPPEYARTRGTVVGRARHVGRGDEHLWPTGTGRPMSDAPVLSVRGLRVHYGTVRGAVRAVDRVSFEIGAGEVLGLVGESGCGKSTLPRGILGLRPGGAFAEGQGLSGGRTLVGLPPKELRRLRGPELGLIFQEPMTRLDPLQRIEDHFRETLEQHEPNLTN